MAKCSRCYGVGYEEYEDDGRMQCDDCYHCSGTGEVDDDTAFSDKLVGVAETIAYLKVRKYIRDCNNNPEGEGFDFMAAENMTSPFELEQALVYEKTGHVYEKLNNLPMDVQKDLVRMLEAREDFSGVAESVEV